MNCDFMLGVRGMRLVRMLVAVVFWCIGCAEAKFGDVPLEDCSRFIEGRAYDDLSAGYVVYNAQGSFFAGRSGWTTYNLNFTLMWSEEEKRFKLTYHSGRGDGRATVGYGIETAVDARQVEAVARLYNERAEERGNPKVYVRELISSVGKHEQRHRKDLMKYPQLAWGKGVSPTCRQEKADEKYGEILRLLEARAIRDQIEYYKQHRWASRRMPVDAYEQAKTIILSMHAQSQFYGQPYSYQDVYMMYEASSDEELDAELERLAGEYEQMLFREAVCAIALEKHKPEFHVETRPAKNERRAVCRPCYMGDTLGCCGYWWCCNVLRKHSEYDDYKREGDYIPASYSHPGAYVP